MGKNSMQEDKRHYKMYKSGSQWMTAAIISFGAGLIVFGGAQTNNVHADTSTPAEIQTTQTAAKPAADATKAPAAAEQTATAKATTAATTTPAKPAATTETTAPAATTTPSTTAATTDTTTQPVATQNPAAKAAATTPQAATQPATNADTPADSSDPATTTDANTKPANEDTLDKGNVQGLWAEGYQSQGMVVAVIDSGVQAHADLRLSDDSTATITKADAEAQIAKKGYGTYINSKIPFAYDYSNNDSINTGTTVSGSTHGEHVAGIIAANGTTADGATGDEDATVYVKGVAPEAQILAMQVIDEFPDENTNDISRAIHDAVDLGANAIQMSLGIGVAEQDLTDEEQAAVKYATDHGVFVSISASNNANAASIIGAQTPNDISTAYTPKNDSTIADPAASASAMTVAAETSDTGADSQMDGFSSWGPMSDYTLKPDISAPGDNVTSTAIDPTTNTQTYAVESGTSMAGPYDAGAALIVMQKLQQTRPDLKGAELVKAVKLALMNAAEPMKDIQYPDTYISPRRQGAGQIDVSKAGDLTVTAEGTDDAGSVSLNTIGQTTSFSVTLTNHGTAAQNYTVDYDGGPLTQVQDASNGNTVHDQALVGATVNTDTASFTLAAGETKTVTFKLNLDNTVASNQLVEGYLTFKAQDASQTISVPYLGYFGDLTTEQVIDSPANSGQSIFDGGYLVDEDHHALGIADADSLSHLVNTDTTGQYSWSKVPAYVQNGKVSFSPNGDGASDTVYPYVFSKQNLKAVTIDILDAKGNVVRTLDKENNTNKSYLQNGSNFNEDLGLSIDMRLDPDAFVWDGKLYDQATGKYVTAPDGQYTYRIVTEQYNSGAEQDQDYDLPVVVDTAAPTLSGLSYINGRVSATYRDAGVGFTKYSQAVLKINDTEYGVDLNNNGQSNDGSISFDLTNAQKAALEAGDGSFSLTITDVAGNTTTASLQATAGKHTATTEANVPDTAPQFTWMIGKGGYNYLRKEGFVQAVSDQTSFTAYAQVPAGVDWTVFATDAQTGNVFQGDLDPTTGIVTFNLTEGAPYGDFTGTVLYPTATYGVYEKAGAASGDEMIVFLDADGTAGYGHYSEDDPQAAVPLRDNDTAKAATVLTSDAPQLPGRDFDSITTHAQPTKGLTFNDFNDNSFTLVGADQVAKTYDAATGELTISGKVDDPTGKTLTITDASEATKTVALNADGTFSFQVPFKPAQQQAVGYRLTNADGTTAYGQLEIYLDTVFPTLDMPQADTLKVDASGNYDITTTSDTFTVSGTVDDNINGYRLYANGNNLVHQKNLAGFNNHNDPDADSNPYGAAEFTQTYTLQNGDNYFTVTAVDMVGNTTTKIFHVIKLAEAPATSDHTGSTAGSASHGAQPSGHIAAGYHHAQGKQNARKAAKQQVAAQPQPTSLTTHAKASTQQATDADALPQAGEAHSSMLGALGMFLLSVIGLAGYAERKRN